MRKVSHLGNESCAECGSRIELKDVVQGGGKGDLHWETHQCVECDAAGDVLYEPPSAAYRVYGPVFGEDELYVGPDGSPDLDKSEW